MKKLFLAFASLLAACAPAMTPSAGVSPSGPVDQVPIVAEVDLTAVSNDRLPVTIDPGVFSESEVLYRLPRVVQGTYAISDFGQFTEDFVAWDYQGREMPVVREDLDSWRISNATQLDRISYWVNDTYDIEQTDAETPFSPSGTNIEPDVYMLNLHGFVGYFEGMNDLDYEIQVRAPVGMTGSSALPLVGRTTEGGAETDIYRATRYFEVTDNPMMYGAVDTTSFSLSGIDVKLTVYSPSGNHTAAELRPTLQRMMAAQRAYLADLETTNRYDVFLYLAGDGPTAPTGMGALEHQTSTVMVVQDDQTDDMLANSVIDVVSHEFFHVVQPLSVHSEDIQYFDYYDPTFSKHLWFYEGQTEYFSQHFQVVEGLESPDEFYAEIATKIETAEGYPEPMSFTEMSENVTEEPWASSYTNVYMKGALIAMCNDVIIHQQSGGQRSLIGVMREMSEKYGADRPFEDDTFIDEFTSFTYPEVGEFLREHVVGSAPIDYGRCLDPVGLRVREMEGPSTLFVMPKPGGSIRVFLTQGMEGTDLLFPYGPLSSTLEALGVQGGDILRSFNGQSYGTNDANALVQSSIALPPGSPIRLVVERDGREVELTGTMSQSTGRFVVVEPDPAATPEQVALRNAWLGRTSP